jgi:Tfp pilus assembly protein PilO
MMTLFDKLNLRPQERRLVVVAAAVLFVVLNAWLLPPKLKEWTVYQTRFDEAQRTGDRFQKETNNIPAYQKKREELQDQGSFVASEEQALTLVQTVLSAAASANITVQSQTPGGGGAVANNPFFEEQRVTVRFISGEKELVDFLVQLGAGNSLLRVRDMDLKPDPSQQKLVGSVTVIGRYPKKQFNSKPTRGPEKPGGRGPQS